MTLLDEVTCRDGCTPANEKWPHADIRRDAQQSRATGVRRASPPAQCIDRLRRYINLDLPRLRFLAQRELTVRTPFLYSAATLFGSDRRRQRERPLNVRIRRSIR